MLSYAFSLRPLLRPPSLCTPLTYMKLTWTKTDEAPALASYALLPILASVPQRDRGVESKRADISLAGRIVATFPECLRPDQKIPDELTRLGELAKTPEANIVKLPNIRASLPQLRDAIAELQGRGYNISQLIRTPPADGGACGTGAVCRSLGLGRESRVARRQFRPACSRVRESVRTEATT